MEMRKSRVASKTKDTNEGLLYRAGLQAFDQEEEKKIRGKKDKASFPIAVGLRQIVDQQGTTQLLRTHRYLL